MTHLTTIAKYDQLLERIGRLEEAVFENSDVFDAYGTYKEEKETRLLRKLKRVDALFNKK